jgi:hypothetical protein
VLRLLAALLSLLMFVTVNPTTARARPSASDARVPPAATSLLLDMRKIVEVQRSAGWKLFPGADGRSTHLNLKAGWRAGIDWDFRPRRRRR